MAHWCVWIGGLQDGGLYSPDADTEEVARARVQSAFPDKDIIGAVDLAPVTRLLGRWLTPNEIKHLTRYGTLPSDGE